MRGRGRDTPAGRRHARPHLAAGNRPIPGGRWCCANIPRPMTLPPGRARVLTMLDGLGGLAPRLLAADAGGTWSGRPSVLISRLPGQADITPADPRRWAAQLGTALARIQAAPLASLAGLPDVIGRPGGSPGHLAGPAAAIVATAWPRLARAPRVLTHFDFWSGNTCGSTPSLSGVVDWSGAAAGARGFDVGWCRLDLYLLFGEDVADEFLDAYRAAASDRPARRGAARPVGRRPVARRRRRLGAQLPRPRAGRPDRRAAAAPARGLDQPAASRPGVSGSRRCRATRRRPRT